MGRGGKGGSRPLAGSRQPPHVRWLEDYQAASIWARQYDVRKLLKKGKGITKITDFFPNEVAEGILGDLEKVPASAWNATKAHEDHSQNNISHSFQSVRQATCMARVTRVLSLLLPDSLHSFSAAKYTRNDHIAPHDDRQYTQVCMEDGSIVTCSRDIALIVYLTKDWQTGWGGLLVDLDAAGGPTTYVPQFNSAILFTIPRWHQVTPMTTDRPRYTLFGWWLVPGKTYPLNLGNDKPPGGAAALKISKDCPVGGKNRKRRRGSSSEQVQQQGGGGSAQSAQAPDSSMSQGGSGGNGVLQKGGAEELDGEGGSGEDAGGNGSLEHCIPGPLSLAALQRQQHQLRRQTSGKKRRKKEAPAVAGKGARQSKLPDGLRAATQRSSRPHKVVHGQKKKEKKRRKCEMFTALSFEGLE